jgi:transcriptional regulator with XRE-family HTH domain
LNIGKELKEWRKASNLTLPQLAKEAGVSKGYLSLIENEKVKNISVTMLKKLFGVMDVRLSTAFKAMEENENHEP